MTDIPTTEGPLTVDATVYLLPSGHYGAMTEEKYDIDGEHTNILGGGLTVDAAVADMLAGVGQGIGRAVEAGEIIVNTEQHDSYGYRDSLDRDVSAILEGM